MTQMRAKTLLLALALAAALTLPTTTFAQSAGDDQYSDPFQDPQGQDQGGGGDSSGSQGGASQGNGTAQPPSDQQLPSEPTTVAPSQATDAAVGDGSETLPVTGLPAVGVALAGMFLLAGGAALRRRA
jgi:hypothetical protein